MSFWKTLQRWGHKLSAPAGFDKFTACTLPWLTPLAWATLIVAFVWGLAFAPMDYQQKNVFRIIYVHVPSALLSMSIYMMMAVASICYFIWRLPLAAIFARAAAPYGALLTALALITGSIWGKPTWGTYWTWDARLTSELILLFIYLGYIMLQNSFEDRHLGDRMSAILCIVGVINIPIIHYSVVWWNTLHQGATLKIIGKSEIADSMLWPLLIAMLAFYLLFFSYVIRAMQNQILQTRISRIMER